MHEKAVLGTMFQIVFTPCLQIPLTCKDKKQPFYRVITNFFVIADKSPYLIATGKAKVQALSKNISHLYEFLWGCWQPFLGEFQIIFLCSHLIGQKNCIFHPSRRRIYNLFTKFNSPPTYKDKNSAKYPLVKNIPHLYP